MKEKYEIRRGFRAPTPFDDSSPDTATYEIWRKRSMFGEDFMVDVFNNEAVAEAACRVLNGRGKQS